MEYVYPIYKTQYKYKLIFTHTYIYQSGYIFPFKFEFEFVLNFHELHLIYVQWLKILLHQIILVSPVTRYM